MMLTTDVEDLLKPILLKDLRTQCRARGLTPAGSREALQERLKENMLATGDYELHASAEGRAAPGGEEDPAAHAPSNNYHRPEGQNVGNFVTERNSSRVLAPPGGGSQIIFGDEGGVPTAKAAGRAVAAVSVDAVSGREAAATSNNYHRPAGQNVGNFLTERNSSRVLAPPGGSSQITFG